jgi:hypothetical protein
LTATEFIKRRVEDDLQPQRLCLRHRFKQLMDKAGFPVDERWTGHPTKQNTFSIRRGPRISLLVAHVSLVTLWESIPLRAAARAIVSLHSNRKSIY